MGKLDNGKANLHMYCLQGNLRPFLKPFSIFCHWENKTDLKKNIPPPSKKKPTTKEPKKTTKKAKKQKTCSNQ